MKFPSIKKLVAATAATAAAISIATAAPYQTGSKVEGFTAKDQHEKDFTFKPAESRFLLVSHDMETGKKANGVLSPLGKDYLTGKKAVYLANVHGMPGIGRMFAMPKMKKYNHRIILGDDAALIANFPQQAGKVTVIALSDGKVKSVSYWAPGADPVESFLK